MANETKPVEDAARRWANQLGIARRVAEKLIRTDGHRSIASDVETAGFRVRIAAEIIAAEYKPVVEALDTMIDCFGGERLDYRQPKRVILARARAALRKARGDA